jgi:hypothetical protein
MSFISSCPQCQKQVTVPDTVASAAAASETIVRCPLCDAEYPLSQAMPPMLIIVRPAAAAGVEAEAAAGIPAAVPEALPAEAAAMPEAVPAGEEHPLEPAAPRDPWQLVEEEAAHGEGIPFAAEEKEELEGGEAVDFAAITGRAPAAAPAEGAIPALPQKKRRRKREVTALGLVGRFVGMFVMAVLGLVCAFLIGSFFKANVDTLHLFHPGRDGQQGVRAAWASLWGKPPPSAEERLAEEQPPAAAPENAPAAKPAPPSQNGPPPKSGVEKPPVIPGKKQPEGPAAAPAEKALQPAVKKKPAAEPPVVKAIGPREAPSYGAADLAAALGAVNAVCGCPACNSKGTVVRDGKEVPCDVCKGKPWDKIAEQITDDTYDKLRRLAEVLTFYRGAVFGTEPTPAVEVLERIGQSPQAVEKVMKMAWRTLNDPAKVEGGILLAGTVTTVAEKDGLFAVLLKMDPSPDPIRLFSDQSLGVKQGDRIVVPGCIIYEPAKNLAGYSGSQSRVIWTSGLNCKLP